MSDVVSSLLAAFPELFPDEGSLGGDGPIVPADRHVELARHLKEELGFTLYVTVVGSHWPPPPLTDEQVEAGETPETETFEVATVLRQPRPGGVAWHWRVKLVGDETIPTLCPLFAGADWQEREQYDLVGVVFDGHPDMRRLMMPDDWVGHPLRKDYAIDTPCPPWR